MKNGAFLFLLSVMLSCSNQPLIEAPTPPFILAENKNTTPTYEEGMAFWNEMADYYSEISITPFGNTDAGIPLHLIIIDSKSPQKMRDYRNGSKQILLINNAIHPGEPDGVDASMLLADHLMQNDSAKQLLDKAVVCIIPFYNIGGALNRNSTTRANQNGPEEYGFRGNAQNLDLNRDFIKMDSKNAQSFAELIDILQPDLYIETHVSNGADYPYVMTYLSTQEDKIGEPLTSALRNEYTPFLKSKMTQSGFEMCPYVNVHGTPPDNGYATFYDSPRYSTGFLALKGIPGYITETHMLKPYPIRVKATFEFLKSGVEVMNAYNIRNNIIRTQEKISKVVSLPIDWEVDYDHADSLLFKGYAHQWLQSDVTGKMRSKYHRDQPWQKNIPYWGSMKPTLDIEIPDFYVLKRGYTEVEKRLKLNGIRMFEILADTILTVEVYHIKDYQTGKSADEKHYSHSQTSVQTSNAKISFRKGDYIIPLNNTNKRFIIEVLEPMGPDSYFNWNFFDAILQQKEWYSGYVFEDEAYAMLQADTSLMRQFQIRKKNPDFSNNPQAQLYWIYKNSARYEKTHLRYPVFRGWDNPE
jgi:hypothetical protein